MANPDGRAPIALPAWAGETGWEQEIILSTRARLARNLAGLPFPGCATETQLKSVVSRTLKAARHREKGLATLRPVEVSALGPNDRAALVDSHLISVQHATAGPHRWALVDDKHTVSVMVNEEDHLRVQAILPGLQLEPAWRIADRLDELFGSRMEYARDAEYGFLTASLANFGTGLRLSVMAHLPGLAQAGKLEDKVQAARALGVSVRGPFGEDGEAAGDVYQLSNALTFDITTRQIIARLIAVTVLIVADEQAARELLWKRERSSIEAHVSAAQNKLKTAQRLSAGEALTILSALRLGAALGLPTGVSCKVFSTLLVSMRLGVPLVSGQKAQTTFYEETRRPAFLRNSIRGQAHPLDR